MNELFRRFAAGASGVLGSSWAFVAALAVIIIWLLSGPIFRFSDTWQLIINTGTTIVTFLMIFLVQNSQNRDTRAIQLKLDEVIRALEGARTRLVNLENLPDEEIDKLKEQFEELADSEATSETLPPIPPPDEEVHE